MKYASRKRKKHKEEQKERKKGRNKEKKRRKTKDTENESEGTTCFLIFFLDPAEAKMAAPLVLLCDEREWGSSPLGRLEIVTEVVVNLSGQLGRHPCPDLTTRVDHPS